MLAARSHAHSHAGGVPDRFSEPRPARLALRFSFPAARVPRASAISGWRLLHGPKLRLSSQSLVVQVAPPTVTVISTPGGGPFR